VKSRAKRRARLPVGPPQKPNTPVLPVWARVIRVVQFGTKWHVHGEGRKLGYPLHSSLRIEDEVARNWGAGSEMCAQFGNAQSNQELLNFIGKYGPIEGTQVPINENWYASGRELDITIEQDVAVANKFQTAMRAFLSLISNIEAQDTLGMMNCLGALEPFDPADSYGLSGLLELAMGAEAAFYDRRDVRVEARQVVCHIFNQFPEYLVATHDNRPIYWPERRFNSILPELMFFLKREYLGGGTFRICAHPKCGNIFVPRRLESRGCNEDCARKLRQIRCWPKRGQQRRAKRLRHE